MRGIMRFLFAGLILLSAMEARAAKLIPVDVVMTNGELYFVLEDPCNIEFLRVSEVPAVKKPGPKTSIKTFWLLGYDVATPVKSRKYHKLKQIKYSEKYSEFQWVEGPLNLKWNVKYLIEINSGDKMAREIFYISSDDKAVMPAPAFERQKNRTYSVTAGKDGSKVLVPVEQKNRGQ